MAGLYALLVGINDYPDPVPRLSGCVNDIAAWVTYLQERVDSAATPLHLRVLKNQEATRDAVIQAFREHLGQAVAGDSVLFGFCGHGSQENAPPEFWHLEPDHLNETLVCWDSRLSSGWDLADKELAKLIAEVAQRHPHIAVILDCCHSGSGSRLLNSRYVEPDRRPRPIQSYYGIDIATTRSGTPATTPIQRPRGRHVLLAACRDIETAKEYTAKQRGAFSYFLMETLQQASSPLSYRDIFQRTSALIRTQVPNQSPQLEASTHPEDLDLSFLQGFTLAKKTTFTVSYDAKLGWGMDGGTIHGIPAVEATDTTQLALFPFDSPPEQLANLLQAVGTAEITAVLPQRSQMRLLSGDLPTDQTFKAVVTRSPLPRIAVALEGDPAGIDWVQTALQQAGDNRTPSLYVKAVDPTASEARLRVIAAAGQYHLTTSDAPAVLVEALDGFNAATATQLVQRLEHMARWMMTAALCPPSDRQIPANAVQMQIYSQGNPMDDPIHLTYTYQDGSWQQPSFQIKLVNHWDHPLYCTLLDLTVRYAVQGGLLEAGGVWLRPGEETWALGGQVFYASVPKALWEQGISECRDLLKLIACTEEFDARLLEQDELEMPSQPTRALHTPRNALERLIQRVHSRAISRRPEANIDSHAVYWTTQNIDLVTIRPLPQRSLTPANAPIILGVGAQLHPHPTLRTDARLIPWPQARSPLQPPSLPLIFTQDSGESDRFTFTPEQGLDPGLSLLELRPVDAAMVSSVTPEQPLQLTLETVLQPGEYLLPIAFDGEFYWPLGRSHRTDTGTQIWIERLPAPLPDGTRTIRGSIRIFFQKVLNHTLELASGYPQLAAVSLLANGEVAYETDVATLRVQGAVAKRVLLLIHGLLGDSAHLIADLRQDAAIAQILHQNYDLVLALDYESINTSIEETARQLKQRLEHIGFGPETPKKLDLLADELGGLVGRWFIEQETGHPWVNRALFLGTPHGGTPWSTLQTWVTAALGIGLNSLATVAWPVQVVGRLVAALERVDVTLDQMQPDAAVLQSLETSPDPHVPYIILHGNASIQSAALAPMPQGHSVIQRFLDKLLGRSAQVLFLGQPNDLFASSDSLCRVDAGRSPRPRRYEVPCDHFTYLKTQASLDTLRQLLEQL